MSHGVDAEGLMSYIHDLYTAGKRNQIRSIMTSIALLCGDLDEYVDAMVQHVNETEVSTEDCLSDHVQHYDSKEAVIENAEKRVSRLEKEKAETEALKKSRGYLIFNFLLTVAVIAALSTGVGKSYVIFMLGLCVLLAVNYPDQKIQDKLVKKHAPAALIISATLFAAGAMVGIFDGTGMLEAMANATSNAPSSFA